jgi:uncharacterized protein (DUF3084 family)
MAVALDHLGIEYGEDRHGQADAKTTRQWVKEQAAPIRKKQKELEAQAEAQAEAQVAQEAQLRLDQLAVEAGRKALTKEKADLAERETAVAVRERELEDKSKAVAARETEIESRETAATARETAVLEREKSADDREAILADQKIRIEADARALDERERNLDVMLDRVRSLVKRVSGIVKTWAEDLGLTVPGPIKTVQDLEAQLEKIEDDNRDRIAQLDPPDPDRDQDWGGPGF